MATSNQKHYYESTSKTHKIPGTKQNQHQSRPAGSQQENDQTHLWTEMIHHHRRRGNEGR